MDDVTVNEFPAIVEFIVFSFVARDVIFFHTKIRKVRILMLFHSTIFKL